VEISNLKYVESKGKDVTMLNYTPCQEVTANNTCLIKALEGA
jgi:hypothetical protein